MTWLLWVALAAVAGIAIGFFAGRSSSAGVKRSMELDQELRAARDELERYRSGVVEHFTTTAQLINRLTADYREVYQHLSRGAQELAGGHVPRLEALAAPQAERLEGHNGELHDGDAAAPVNGAGEPARSTAAALQEEAPALTEAPDPDRIDDDLTLDRDESIVRRDGLDGEAPAIDRIEQAAQAAAERNRDDEEERRDGGRGDGWYDDAAPGAEIPDYARDEPREGRRTGAGSD